MSPALLPSLAGIRPCPACGSCRVTIAREQVLELHLAAGVLAGYRSVGLVTRAECDGCRTTILRREDRGREGADVFRAGVPPVAVQQDRRFELLEVDD